MELIDKQEANNTSVRLGFTLLFAIYCLVAVFTSVPIQKSKHLDAAPKTMALVVSREDRLLLVGKVQNARHISSYSGAFSRKWWQQHVSLAQAKSKWWQRHQSTALLQGKWWQRHQQGQQSPPTGIQVANLAFGLDLNNSLTNLVPRVRPDKAVKAAAKTEPQAKPQLDPVTPKVASSPKPVSKPAIIAKVAPAASPVIDLQPEPVVLKQGAMNLLPAVLKKAFARFEKKPAGVQTDNQCFEGKIAGWSGIKLMDKHKELIKTAGLQQTDTTSDLLSRLTNRGFTPGTSVFLRIFKDRSELEVWLRKDERYALFRTYKICRWSGSFGPKLYEGDKQSPEGFYHVNRQLFDRPSWKWKDSFSIGYPNAYDKLHGRTGSLILVHGGCTSSGCFAMTDPVIQEVHQLAQLARDNGQDSFSIHVYPFELTANNLKKHANSPWMPFWNNLKEGYDLFEKTGLPPKVRVCNGRYVFARHEEERAGTGWSGKGCYGLAAFVPGWKPAGRVAANGRKRDVRWKRSSGGARCNPKRASCRKWVALKRKRSIRKSSRKRRVSSKRRRVARKASSKRRASMRRARAIGRRSPKVQLAH